MKNNLFKLVGGMTLFALMFTFIIVFGQTNKEENTYVYTEALIRWNGFGKWMTTEIDLGTNVNVVDVEREELENKVRTFKNGVDIMNYLSKKGWDFVDKTPTQMGNTHWVTYTFRKLK